MNHHQGVSSTVGEEGVLPFLLSPAKRIGRAAAVGLEDQARLVTSTHSEIAVAECSKECLYDGF